MRCPGSSILWNVNNKQCREKANIGEVMKLKRKGGIIKRAKGEIRYILGPEKKFPLALLMLLQEKPILEE